MQRFAAAIATLLLLAAGQARAGYQFVFTNSGGTVQSNFNLDFGNPNTYVDVYIYLLATGATDIATLQTDGLRSYGVNLNYSGVQAQVLNNTPPNIVSNAGFNDVESAFVTGTSATINDSIAVASANVTAAAGSDRIFLAAFRFTGLANGIMTNITLDPDPTPGVDDTITGGNVVLDSLIANSSATITVTNVPEPGTTALTGLLAAGIAAAARRHRRTRTA